ncbi:MAG: M20 aminoacylase family protein [Pseudomonadota bacterium]
MPVINRVSDFHDEATAWRRDLHEHPELLFEVHRTAGVVEEKLKEFGVDEITNGIGRTGVVGVIKGRQNTSCKVIGLRADMDALPIKEVLDLPYKSKTEGVMHACGHDGHTAMLLAAAKYLTETRNFDGTVVVIFQPAEEGGGGGDEMVKDGLMERWSIDEVYGLHNAPGVPFGAFAFRPGPILAAADRFDVTITALGGHAARPHECNDPMIVAAQLLTAFQSIVSRNTDPLESLVISTTMIQGSDAYNVIPEVVTMCGTVRTLSAEVRDLAERRLGEICAHTGAAFGAKVDLHYDRGYPVTVNHEDQTAFAAEVAADVVGPEKVDTTVAPIMGAEDFSYMLEARPGAFVFLGQGDGPICHHPEYDFNDDIIPIGASYWCRLVEKALPVA